MSAADKLAQALRDVLVTLNRANQHPGPITDTIWHGPGETLFDFIENTLAAHEAEKAQGEPVAVPLIARSFAEWHFEDGPVSWWAWNGHGWAQEPAWIGTPNSNDWPGYHTHWTPHPEMPDAPSQKGGR